MRGAEKSDVSIGHNFYRDRFQKRFHPALAGKRLHEGRLFEFLKQMRSNAAGDEQAAQSSEAKRAIAGFSPVDLHEQIEGVLAQGRSARQRIGSNDRAGV